MHNKLKTLTQLKTIIKQLKARGKKIVFTNGCFDILHRGHVEYLAKAKSSGDVLIIGLNADSSVKRLKGASRPVNKQEDRAIVLAALESVDYIVLFSQDTPFELITAIKPDILVKGGDWKLKDIVGSDVVQSYKGKVMTIPFVKRYSTTGLIKKVEGTGSYG